MSEESRYSNPPLPEDINVSRTHPLADFARLLGGIAIVAALSLGALMLAASYLAKYIPFNYEVKLAGNFERFLPARQPAAVRLQSIADRLARAHALPAQMAIRLHYVNEDIVNAFATLGGHVVVYRGLLEKMPSENALAMVLSHEIAHIKLRHPISAAGRGVVFGVALASVSAATGGDLAAQVLGGAGLLTALSFSREQEREADAHGLAALAKVYGDAVGAEDVFRILAREAERLPRSTTRLSPHSPRG